MAIVVLFSFAGNSSADPTGAGTEDDPYIVTMFVGDHFDYNPTANLDNSKFYCMGEAIDGDNAFITLTGDPFNGYQMSGVATTPGNYRATLVTSWTVGDLTQTAFQYMVFSVKDDTYAPTPGSTEMSTGAVESCVVYEAAEGIYGGSEGESKVVGKNTTTASTYVRWDWGDGEVVTTLNEACYHDYEKEGTYTIIQTAYSPTGEAYGSAAYTYTVGSVSDNSSSDSKSGTWDVLPYVLLIIAGLLIVVWIYMFPSITVMASAIVLALFGVVFMICGIYNIDQLVAAVSNLWPF